MKPAEITVGNDTRQKRRGPVDERGIDTDRLWTSRLETYRQKPSVVGAPLPMSNLDLRTFETYDGFAEEWHEETLAEADVTLENARDRGLLNEQGTRQLWQLLGLLDDELVIQLPEWLAAEKVGSTERTTPTLFVGRVARETEKAVLFEDSAAAQPLMALAHRIHSLEDGLSNTDADDDRRGGLERRLQDTQEAFRDREGMVGLRDEWVPKSQIRVAVRRKPPAADRP